MGKAAFMDKYIVCPYFRRIETNQICCEGVDGASTSRMAFRNMKELKDYAFRTCATAAYGLCPLARGITEYLEAELDGKK
jgi:hypothetical protein